MFSSAEFKERERESEMRDERYQKPEKIAYNADLILSANDRGSRRHLINVRKSIRFYGLIICVKVCIIKDHVSLIALVWLLVASFFFINAKN